MTDHMLDIADPLTGWRRRQQERAQRRAEGKAEQVRAEGRGEATGNPLGLSCDEDGISFGDPQFDKAFAETIGGFVGETRNQMWDEIDAELAARDRAIAELRAENAELKGLVGGCLAAVGQRDRSRGNEDERVAAAIDKLEARTTQALEGQLRWFATQIAELRGQIEGINTRERGPKGPQGERGHRGPPGRPGRKGDSGMTPRVAMIKGWIVDRKRYSVTPILTDNTVGSMIELRGLFEQFNQETS
jgi:hypothetical protein